MFIKYSSFSLYYTFLCMRIVYSALMNSKVAIGISLSMWLRQERIGLRCRRPGFNLGWEDPLEKGMATYSSVLVWRIPWTEEPVRLQSLGSQRVGYHWVTLLGFPGGARGKELDYQWRKRKRCEVNPWVGKIPWRRSWQSTPVFLSGESHGQKSLVGYSP